MGFTVEDGNGLAAANSYATVQDFKDFAEFRVGVTVPDNDTDIQKALVTASSWIDTNFENAFKGYRAYTLQALAFPRAGLIGDDGTELPVGFMPAVLRKAVCILAVEALKGDPLYTNASGAARVMIEDSIGPIIRKYAPQDPTALTVERQFPEVRATLAPLLRGFGALLVSRA